MSRICIAIIQTTAENRQSVQRIATEYAHKYFGVRFTLSYAEPFLKRYDGMGAVILDITDHKDCENCEMLLLPDGSSVNGRTNPIQMTKRMQALSEMLEKITEVSLRTDLFIGDSGTEYDWFDMYEIEPQELPQVVETGYHNDDSPQMHFAFIPSI